MEYYRRHNRYQQPKRTNKLKFFGLIALVLLAIGGGWLVLQNLKEDTPPPKTAQNDKTQTEQTKPKPPIIDLQPTTDAWLAKQSTANEYSYVVYDPDNDKVIATHGGDTPYFTASIYKIYVAYLAYLDIDAGKINPAETLQGGRDIKTCLHDMIHSSDSPCGEAMLAKLGQAETTNRLKEYGLTGTSFPAFLTTANDSLTILKRLHAKQDLTDASTKSLLDSMKDQIYRQGFPAGAPNAVIYDKIGFSETPHWHDVGIMQLPNGRNYLYAFLSKGSGSKQVADFAATIYAALNK